MKISFRLLMILLLVIGSTSCKKEKENLTEELVQKSKALSGSVADSTSAADYPELTSDFLVSIYETQELIKLDQQNIELRQKYCDQAYLKDRDVFISMGIGRMHNPETGQPVSKQFYERAALLDALRWALYGENWLKNDYQPDFGQLKETASRSNEIIDSAVVGDSLFLFIATNLALQ